jgi:hypothetical protein
MGIRCLRLGCLATLLVFLYVPSVSGEIRGPDAKQVGEHLSGIGIPFIANSGQTDPAVAYYAQTFAGTVFVTRDGRIVYSLPGEKDPASAGRSSSGRRGGWSLIERPVGGCPSRGATWSPGSAIWDGRRAGGRTCSEVSLGVWPGISLTCGRNGRTSRSYLQSSRGDIRDSDESRAGR